MAKGRAFAKPLKATRTEFDGIVYDSKSEAARARVLAGLRAQGEIFAALRQVGVDLGEPDVDMPYRVDFLVFKRLPAGSFEVWAEDVKGYDSPTWRRHLKQWAKRGAIPLRTIRRGEHEATTPGGRKFIGASHAGRIVGGVDYRNLAVASRAVSLHAARDRGEVVAFFRNPKVDRPGFDPVAFDFLSLQSDPRGGVFPIFETFRRRGDSDGFPPGVHLEWCPFPVRVYTQVGPASFEHAVWWTDRIQGLSPSGASECLSSAS